MIILNNNIKREVARYIFKLKQLQLKQKPTGGNQRNVSKLCRRRILKRDGNKCLRCGSKNNLTLDHIIPVAKGGIKAKWNLQTLCGKCNSYKGEYIISYI